MVLRVSLANDPNISEDFPFEVDVMACVVTALAIDGTIPPQSYLLDSQLSIPLPALVQSPTCGDDITVEVSGVPAGLITGQDEANPTALNVFSDNDDDEGEYTVTIAFTIVNSLGQEFTE